MGRDIFVQDLPPGIESIADIADDFAPGAIGHRAHFIAAIKEIAPHADFSDPSWGVIAKQNSYHIEVNFGRDEDLESFAFHVAGGAEADALIAKILKTLGLRALDTASESGLFELPTPNHAP
ncbi:hypothetical protein [Paucibacter sp. B51]|uniref:hypothetical protein n=1 Tax=Paucibacter sp. B51 TaxID=2993315 RepID=UPI0022EBE87D|nr:hypothetical protein [Paucibacter sp. B51]